VVDEGQLAQVLDLEVTEQALDHLAFRDDSNGGIELVSIFRFGILGAFFHTLLLFAIVVLAYFDMRRILLCVTGLFFFSNAILTLGFIPFGPAWTGYGYFLASLLSFISAALASVWSIKRLPFMTFVANNPGLH